MLEGTRKTKYPGLYRLPDRRWLVRAAVTDPATRKVRAIRKILPAEVPEADALAELRDLKATIKAGEPAPAAPVQTLGDFARLWLDARSKRLKPSVVLRYATSLERQILPILGHLALTDVVRSEVERWVTWAERARPARGGEYSAETVQGWWRILKQLLGDMAAEHERPDPSARVRPPHLVGRRVKRETRTLTLQEIAALLAAATGLGPAKHALVQVLVTTGARVGEVMALRWCDLDREARTLKISRAVVDKLEGSPKTGVGRIVNISEDTLAALTALRTSQMAEVSRPAATRVSKGLIFPSTSGDFRYRQSVQDDVEEAARLAGIEVHVTPQVLRRTLNSRLTDLGIDANYIRSQMGHVRPAMTARYFAPDPTIKKAAVDALADKIKAQPTSPQ